MRITSKRAQLKAAMSGQLQHHPPLPIRVSASSAKRWGCIVLATPLVAVATLLSYATAGQEASTLSGSGVVIGGEVAPNAHVVENCTQITRAIFVWGLSACALLVTRDEKNDLAVVRT